MAAIDKVRVIVVGDSGTYFVVLIKLLWMISCILAVSFERSTTQPH